MKSAVSVFCSLFIISSCLFAQKHEPVTVKAGASVKDYFPLSERYLYPDFTEGVGIFRNAKVVPLKFNFNLLTCEMEFLKAADTLIITKKQEIDMLVVAKDSFYYHDGYMQKIKSGRIGVFIKRKLEIKDIRKQGGGSGPENRSSSVDSYSTLLYNNGKLALDLKISDDVIFQKMDEYYYSISGGDFIPFTRKNVIRIIQGKENIIKDYIKSNKVDFDSREDLLKLIDFVNKL